MGSCYKLLDRTLYVANPAISCGSSSRATFLSPPKLVPALPLKRGVPVDSSRISHHCACMCTHTHQRMFKAAHQHFRMYHGFKFVCSFSTDFFGDTHLLKLRYEMIKIKGCSGYGGAHSSTCSVSMSSETLRWVFTGAAALLLLLKNTAMRKAFLVPLLVLQAPQGVIHWVRGEYGIWAAFLALLVRLFYYIPGGLECGHCFLWKLLKQYSKRNDAIVQYGGNNGVFSLLGSHMGRNMFILEKDASFCDALPNILEVEAEPLN